MHGRREEEGEGETGRGKYYVASPVVIFRLLPYQPFRPSSLAPTAQVIQHSPQVRMFAASLPIVQMTGRL
jgi:hypothetical protein